MTDGERPYLNRIEANLKIAIARAFANESRECFCA